MHITPFSLHFSFEILNKQTKFWESQQQSNSHGNILNILAIQSLRISEQCHVIVYHSKVNWSASLSY